jgi:hypothetical protein
MSVLLCGFHSTDLEVCTWVVDTYENRTHENKTLKDWVEASRQQLQSKTKMIVCVCNNINDSDLVKDPSLVDQIGSCCGGCKDQTEFVEA